MLSCPAACSELPARRWCLHSGGNRFLEAHAEGDSDPDRVNGPAASIVSTQRAQGLLHDSGVL